MRNRFVVFSQTDAPVMIFSAGHFNLSSVMSDGRVLLVMQVFDIEKGELVRLKILIKFKDDETANHFYEFVTRDPRRTDNMIPVEVPTHINP